MVSRGGLLVQGYKIVQFLDTMKFPKADFHDVRFCCGWNEKKPSNRYYIWMNRFYTIHC